MYPRKKEIRRYVDGLALMAKEWSGPKGWAARAVVSRLIQTMYSDSGSGYPPRNWETIADVQRLLKGSIKEVNARVAEVGGKGTITNLDSRAMKFPKVDVVYFDPPFFKADKGGR